MSYKIGGNQRRPRRDGNIYHFVSHYLDFAGIRMIPTQAVSKPQMIIDELHNLRFHYDRQGWWLKRIDTRRRYYKRVRHDAPFASELPKKINSRIDQLRRVGKPGDVIQWDSYRRCTKVNLDDQNTEQSTKSVSR